MDERTFEIVLSRYPEGLLPSGWVLEGQQIGIAGGILDLLFRDRHGVQQLVELKKGPATLLAVDQVVRYAEQLKQAGGSECVPWVVAHSVPAAVALAAADRGVQTRAISASDCEAALERQGIHLADLVLLRRRTGAAMSGGAGDVWSMVDNDAAIAEMPQGMAALMTSLSSRRRFRLNSGLTQTIIRYRGVKLGGVNRKNQPHGYLTSGVLVTDASRRSILALGFRWMEKHQSSSRHVHTWFQIPTLEHVAFARGVEIARSAVERSLGGESVAPGLSNLLATAQVFPDEEPEQSAQSDLPVSTSTAHSAGPVSLQSSTASTPSLDRGTHGSTPFEEASSALSAVGEGHCRCKIRTGRHYVLWVTLEHLARSGVADWSTVLLQAEQRLRRDHGKTFKSDYMDIDWFRGWMDDGAPKEGAFWEGRDAPRVSTRIVRRVEGWRGGR